MALDIQNVVLVLFFIYFIKMLKKNDSSSSSSPSSSPPPTITPIPPPQIIGPPNPLQQNPSAPGGGVIIDGKRAKKEPIATTLNYLFPVAAWTTKKSFEDVLNHAARGDYPTKQDVKTAFVNDYSYIYNSEFQYVYGGDRSKAKSDFQKRYDTWFDKISDYFYVDSS